MSFDAFITAIALMSDLRAVYPATCLRCGGPIEPGDKVVPIDKTPWAPSGACHRSCWFMPRNANIVLTLDGALAAYPRQSPVTRHVGAANGVQQ